VVVIRTMQPAPVKLRITNDVVNQINVRVGTKAAVSDLAGSDKSVALTVNFGNHTRTIVAGVKQKRTKSREIEGRQALFVVNLEPRKMLATVSEGILFDIGFADGITPMLAVPESRVSDGARAR
jgi:tRNA-binding protein